MSWGRTIPLSYVREALNPGEKIVTVGCFHWFYDITSWFWLIAGLALGALVVACASGYVLHVDMARAFPNLQDGMEGMAREKIVAHYGGWIGLFHDLHPIPKALACACALWGVFVFFRRMVIKYTTEIAVTTQRLIFKRGIVARAVGEMKLDRIEGVQVWQSFFGRIFGYGSLTVQGIGVGHIYLPPIEHPMRFRKALDYARTKYEEIREERMEDVRDRHEERKIDPADIPVDN